MNYTLTNFCEIDKYAIESYCRIHEESASKNLGDISKADTSNIEDFELLVGGSPCFVSGTKVLTEDGYKNIEDLKVDEKVLTHKNRFMPIVKTGGRENQEIYELQVEGFLPVECTIEHPFYCKRSVEENPEKIRLKDIRPGYYIGSYISNSKTIARLLLDLPIDVAIDTFHYSEYGNTIQTTEKEIALKLMLICQKLYNIGCEITFDEIKKLYTITYNGDTTWFIENGIVWYPVKEIKNTGRKENVYNIEVKDDHTYTANNMITYNCQDLSLAGNRNGAMYTCKDCGHKYNPLEAHFSKRDECPHCGSHNLEKTRSSLIVEYLRFLREKQPMFAIYENVKNIIGKEFKPMFDLFIEEVREIGYIPYYEVLNAKYYGIPQNRERVIGVFIRKDINHGFTYPERLVVINSINDVLDKNVEDCYYISKEKTDPLVRELILKNKLSENIGYINNKKFDNNIHQIGMLGNSGYEQSRRVYEKSGIAPTLCSLHGDIKVLEDSHRAFNMNPSRRGMSGCVYNVDGVSPTLTTSELKILYPLYNTVCEYRTDKHYVTYLDNVCGTLRTVDSCGYKRIIEKINEEIKENTTTMEFDCNFDFTSNYLVDKYRNEIELFKKLKSYFYHNNELPSIYNLDTDTKLIYGENDRNIFELTEEKKQAYLDVFGETGYRVRKITPRESFRLMGFNDAAYEKARYYTEEEREELDKNEKKYRTETYKGKEYAVKLSNAQAYKEAGNSIVVNVLYYVFKELKKQYPEFHDDIKVCSLFSGIGAFEQALLAIDNEDVLLKL